MYGSIQNKAMKCHTLFARDLVYAVLPSGLHANRCSSFSTICSFMAVIAEKLSGVLCVTVHEISAWVCHSQIAVKCFLVCD